MSEQQEDTEGRAQWARNAVPAQSPQKKLNAAKEAEVTRAKETEEPILQFFAYGHLPEHLQAVSATFHTLAHQLVRAAPRNAERSVALRKLLEAKDAAVRSVLFKA